MESPTSYPQQDQSAPPQPPDQQHQPPTINTPFPNPPEYWHSFTTENLTAFQSLEAKASVASLPPPPPLPPSLQNLRPPTPPLNGEYRSFGEQRSLSAPLLPLPLETPSLLTPTQPVASPQHLLNLTRSLLLNYGELMHILITDPSPPVYGPKWEDLRDIFRNAYHGLNAYRPWQAKERLISELKERKIRAEREIEGVKGLEGRVEKVLGEVKEGLRRGLGAEGEDEMDVDLGVDGLEVGGGKRKRGEEDEVEGKRRTWEILREELGG